MRLGRLSTTRRRVQMARTWVSGTGEAYVDLPLAFLRLAAEKIKQQRRNEFCTAQSLPDVSDRAKLCSDRVQGFRTPKIVKFQGFS